jgi:hypothetical protein
VDERVDPHVAMFVVFGVVENSKRIISTLGEISIALRVNIVQKIQVVVDLAGPEQVHSFL